jgi:hypothetical protein
MYSEAVIRKSLVFRPDTCISGHSPFEFLDPSHFAWQSRDAEVIRECALCSRHSVLDIRSCHDVFCKCKTRFFKSKYFTFATMQGT